MELFNHQDFDGHEQVLFCTDKASGLTGIIAIHSTVLGPAAGGCRFHPYASTAEALTDVLRLSKGMSYKNAVAGLPLGGGKCVVIAEPRDPRKEDLLRAIARHVQLLGGRYWTAIDIGVSPSEADIMAEESDFIFTRASHFEEGFSPAQFTALGGLTGIRAAAKHVWGRDDLAGLRVAIQGVGATGSDMGRQLHEAGAELVVADVRAEAAQQMVAEFGAEAVAPEEIHAADVDILAPCAMGATLNDDTIPDIKAKAVSGLANNQLAEPRHGKALAERGIAYVPDYVVNAGGMIGASRVIFDELSREKSTEQILGLFDTIVSILERSSETGRPSSEIADEMALEIIGKAEARR